MSFVGDVVGGLFGLAGAEKSADAQRDAARIAAEQAKFTPFDVTTPFGTSQFDTQAGTAGVQLSPEIQQQLQDVGLFTKGFRQQAGQFDPQAFAGRQLEQSRALSAPAERLQRQQLEDRLFSQGQLGTTSGALRSEAFEKALALKDLAREFQAEQSARQEQDRLFSNFISSIGAENQLRRLPLGALELGGQFGGRAAQAGATAAQFPFMAAQNAADANAAAFSQLGQGIGSAAQSLANNFFTPSVNTQQFGFNAALGQPIQGTGDFLSGGPFIPSF